MLAHRPSPCQRHHSLGPFTFQCIGSSNPPAPAQRPAWHFQHVQGRTMLQLQNVPARGTLHLAMASQASEQVATSTTARQPTVDVTSYYESPSRAKDCINAIASAMAADPVPHIADMLQDVKKYYAAGARMALKLRPHAKQLVFASDGEGLSAAIVLGAPDEEELRTYPGWWTNDMYDIFTAVKTSAQPAWYKMMGRDVYEKKRQQFIKKNGGRALQIISFGTDPEHQGRGLDSAVMAKITQLADELQLPLHVVAHKKRFASLCSEYGFKTLAGRPDSEHGAMMVRLPSPLQGDQTTLTRASKLVDSDLFGLKSSYSGVARGVGAGVGEEKKQQQTQSAPQQSTHSVSSSSFVVNIMLLALLFTLFK